MQRFNVLCANGLAATLDYSVGVFGITLIATAYDYSIAWWQILIGGVLALLPDFDLQPAVLSGQSAWYDHRQTLLHRPLLVLPLGSVVAYLLGGSFWALAAFVLILWHYLHDIDWCGTRYGVAWLWPFSRQYISHYGWFAPPPATDHHEWLQRHWLQPSQMSITELSVASVFLIITMVMLQLLQSILPWLVLLMFWLLVYWLWSQPTGVTHETD